MTPLRIRKRRKIWSVLGTTAPRDFPTSIFSQPPPPPTNCGTTPEGVSFRLLSRPTTATNFYSVHILALAPRRRTSWHFPIQQPHAPALVLISLAMLALVLCVCCCYHPSAELLLLLLFLQGWPTSICRNSRISDRSQARRLHTNEQQTQSY